MGVAYFLKKSAVLFGKQIKEIIIDRNIYEKRYFDYSAFRNSGRPDSLCCSEEHGK